MLTASVQLIGHVKHKIRLPANSFRTLSRHITNTRKIITPCNVPMTSFKILKFKILF